MMQFGLNLKAITLAEGKYRKAFGEGVRQCMRHALAEFVREIDSRVPVWSGRSKASLEQVAFFIGTSLNTDIYERTRTKTLKSGRVVRRHYLPKDRRAMGSREGTFRFPASNTVSTFNLQIGTTVPYFGLNDSNSVNHIIRNLRHMTPWHSFNYGFAAFEQYMSAYLVDHVPNIAAYIGLGSVRQTRSYRFETDAFPARTTAQLTFGG